MSKILEVEGALNAAGYVWKIENNQPLATALEGGLKNGTLLHIIRWISDEMRILGNIDEQISSDTSDINSFQLELSSFLKELQCPFSAFITGPVSGRFQSSESLLMLLNYLISELMAMRMARVMNPKSEDMIIELAESDSAAALKQIACDLGLGKLPSNVTTDKLFDQIGKKLKEATTKAGPKRMGLPLFTPSRQLTETQWELVRKFQQELETEYELRRQMLITRLDVTVQSFQWSDRAKSKQDEIESHLSSNRELLDAMLADKESTSVAALLAARDDLTIIEKTSNADIRTHSFVQKHVMGTVPDRGGRANEHAAPAREMPSWKTRVQGNAPRGGGRGGGHRGGANQRGGYQPQRQPNQEALNAGYPSQSSGYRQNVGYGAGDGGRHQQQDGGGQSRVQGGWSQHGNNSGGYAQGNGGQGYSSNNQRGYSNNQGYGGYNNNNSGNRGQNRGGRGGGHRGNRN